MKANAWGSHYSYITKSSRGCLLSPGTVQYLPDECGRFCTGSNRVMWLDTVVLVQHKSLRLLARGRSSVSENATRELMITVLPRGHLWRYIERSRGETW